MTNKIGLLYFKGKISNRHIRMSENSKTNEKYNDFIIWLPIIK